ncbi:efflux RND transporter periplasmic adaptor subunit [Mesorhizobium sp. SARCC-RB16n]|uniref:efflux RND transporter periplasmic adaptor subunit n=1 Tax=Mesorhizobium sp. SARCC-RB16n TaxID=2116687 RepID=UPI00122F7F36|nr:efflux RND transporter periplasmic adaptor subunit [Mesorhizobium sp. SARCC-RB16n]KAA3442105.1 efflux RND transporter periplasmic adaptor subunit [Mesorhizobium sp. SARCC-RB16n]
MSEQLSDKQQEPMEPEPVPAARPRRSRFFRLLLAIALCSGGAYAAYTYVGARPSAAAVPPAAPTPPTPVNAAQAQLGNVPIRVTGLGTVQPFNSVTVKPRVSGQIKDIVFTEGQTVHANDVLAHLDPSALVGPLHQAEANLAKDQALLANTQADLQRISQLAQKGFASSQTLETQKAQIAQTEAMILVDKAAIESAQTQLDYATISSPIDGVAGIRMIDEGNMITPSDPGIVTINQLEPISVVFTVPSEAIGDWPVGAPASAVAITALAANDDRPLGSGTLSLVDNHIDPATATIRLKATFPNKDHQLKPGQFVKALFQSALLSQATSVPSTAVQQSTNGTYVYLIKPGDSTLVQQPVKVKRVAGDVTVIASGLSAGDTVVTDGQYSLKPGMKVSALSDSAVSQNAAAPPAIVATSQTP